MRGEGSGFEQGAGMSMSDSTELLTMVLVSLLFFSLIIILVGGLTAWRKQQIELGEYGGYILRGFIFLTIIVSFLGLT